MDKFLVLWQARSLVVFALCVMLVLTPISLLHAFGVKSELKNTAVEVLGLQRNVRMARHFETRYKTIASKAETSINPRVFWTGRLQSALAGFTGSGLAFSIADPVALPVEFTGRVSEVLVSEYLVQLSVHLEGDTALLGLLNRMQAIEAGFIRNRSCDIKRSGNAKPLRLNCVYSILNLLIREINQ